MNIEDYGEWTIATYPNKGTVYLKGIVDTPFAMECSQYKDGERIYFMSQRNGSLFIMGAMTFLGTPGPRFDLNTKSLNSSLDCVKPLKHTEEQE